MQTLDVVIGLVIFFLFLSLVASALVEMIAALVRKRGKLLRDAVDAATNGGDDFNNALYLHPLIYGLFESEKVGMKERKALPSYIPSEVFAQAYVETVIGMPIAEVGDLGMVFSSESRIWPDKREVPDRVEGEQAGVSTLTFGEAIKIRKRDLDDAYHALRPHVVAAGGDRKETLRRVAVHFDRVNERVTGRYRRWVSYWLFGIGVVLAAATNGDATRIANRLVNNADLRQALVQSAELNLETENQTREATLDRIRVIEGITGGWQSDPLLAEGGLTPGAVVIKVLGFFITAFAVSLGAPFWFDLLNKLLKLRKIGAGKDDEVAEAKPMPRPATVGELGTSLSALNSGEPLHGLLLPPETIAQLGVLAQHAQHCYAAPAEFEMLVNKSEGTGAGQATSTEKAKVTFISHQALVPLDDAIPGNAKLIETIPVDTQVFVIRTATQIIVACRGTEPKVLHDIATDVRCKPAKVDWAPDEKDIRVHRGFAAALEIVWEELAKAITASGDDVKVPVYFTGHSLGGALAVLAAARFIASDANNYNRFGGLHTFGQPRVGNSAFADWATQLFRGRYTRAVNHRDIVPQLPPPKVGEWEFKHFGIVHVFDGAGRLSINPGWFFRLADYALPDQELKAMFKQPVQNHDSFRYASLYAALAEPPKTIAA